MKVARLKLLQAKLNPRGENKSFVIECLFMPGFSPFTRPGFYILLRSSDVSILYIKM